MITSLYIHVPFCLSRCGYCNFYSGEPLEELAGYPALVAAEAKLRATQLSTGPLKTLYFGGGTPSLLGAEGLGKILEAVQAIVLLEENAEVTVEVNPAARLPFTELAKLGITRVSIGVQALDDKNLAHLGRTHSAAEALATVKAAAAAGLSVSSDLIYGYRGLTCDALVQAASALIACGVNHLSAYSLESTDVGSDSAAATDDTANATCAVAHTTGATGTIVHADAEQERAHLLALTETLAALGVIRYEVSNFARPGFESRHNTNYWEGGGYLGLGPGAHGYLPEVGAFGERYENRPDLAAYRASVQKGALPPMTHELLTQQESLLERLLLNLRRASTFSTSDILPGSPQGLGALRKLLQELCRSGDLVALGSDYAPTPTGLERADGLALWLFERLKSQIIHFSG